VGALRMSPFQAALFVKTGAPIEGMLFESPWGHFFFFSPFALLQALK